MISYDPKNYNQFLRENYIHCEIHLMHNKILISKTTLLTLRSSSRVGSGAEFCQICTDTPAPLPQRTQN